MREGLVRQPASQESAQAAAHTQAGDQDCGLTAVQTPGLHSGGQVSVGHVEGQRGQRVGQAQHQEGRECRAGGEGGEGGEGGLARAGSGRGGGWRGHQSSTAQTECGGEGQPPESSPPAPGVEQRLAEGGEEESAQPGRTEDETCSQGAAGGEVGGGDDHTGQVHQTEPQPRDEAVAEDQSLDVPGQAGQEETGGGEGGPHHADSPLPPALHQEADQGRTQTVNSNLEAAGHGEKASATLKLLQQRLQEDPVGVAHPVQDADTGEAGRHHQPAVPTSSLLRLRRVFCAGDQTLLFFTPRHLRIIL